METEHHPAYDEVKLEAADTEAEETAGEAAWWEPPLGPAPSPAPSPPLRQIRRQYHHLLQGHVGHVGHVPGPVIKTELRSAQTVHRHAPLQLLVKITFLDQIFLKSQHSPFG